MFRSIQINRMRLEFVSHGRTVSALALVVVLGVLGSGCLQTAIPAQMSASKFVRQSNSAPPGPTAEPDTTGVTGDDADQESDGGKVTASTGLLFNVLTDGSDSQSMLLLFPVEGAWTGWLGERYDLSISANSFGFLGVEGNGALVANSSIRMGLLHGIQLGAVSDLESPGDGAIGTGASAGVFLQTTGNSRANFFIAARYAFNILMNTDDPNADFSFNHAVFNLGGAFSNGRLQVIPEIIVDAAFLHDSDFVYIMIVPTITVSANY